MKQLLFTTCCLVSFFAIGQQDFNIVEVIDKLRYKWDASAIGLKSYQGIQEFCENKSYRDEVNELLDAIHHWDTTLYFIVSEKYADSEDKEAALTLKDIEQLESEYSTANFKAFISDECNQLKIIHESFDQETVRKYEKDIRNFEKELYKYINSITYRIDIIDEHVHHLKLD